MDWEEVERIVPRITLALEEAQKGLPDSPVHALLPGSLADESASGARLSYVQSESRADAEPLADYQKLVAEHWRAQGLTADDLLREQRETVFGSRALAYLCLKTEPLTDIALEVSDRLNGAEQYRLANELYSLLYKAGKLNWNDLLVYASCYTEANPDLAGADHAIALVEEAFRTVKQQYSQQSSDANSISANAACHRRLAGLRQWRWQLSREHVDLDLAISAFADAILHNDHARNRGELKHPGFLAQARLKQLILLRIRDKSRDRPDAEGHLDAILALHPQPRDDTRGLSYLGWFQAITLADLGAAEEARHLQMIRN